MPSALLLSSASSRRGRRARGLGFATIAALLIAAEANANSIAVPSATGTCGVGNQNAARFDGNCGAQVTVVDTSAAFVQDSNPNGEATYQVRFHVNLRRLVMGDGDSFDLFTAYDDTDTTDPAPGVTDGVSAFRVTVQQTAGVKKLVLSARHGVGEVSTAPVALQPGWRSIEVSWARATSGSNGTVAIWLDGFPCDGVDHSGWPQGGPPACNGLGGLNNGTNGVDYVRWGGTGFDAGNGGSFYLDDFSSRQNGYIGPATVFSDVPTTHWAWRFVQAFYSAEIHRGCGPDSYCPTATVPRRQMAVFMVKSIYGPDYVPPPATGVFSDVPASDPDARFIEKLYADGLTAGCSTPPAPPAFCPDSSVTRAEMAVFLLVLEHGPGYTPPAATGSLFSDVPVGQWYAPWAEQLYEEELTAGCNASPLQYCPSSIVQQAEMATFLSRAFSFQLPQLAP